MIILISEKIDPWLKYIWEEFCRIHLLKEETKFLTLEEYKNKSHEYNQFYLVEYGAVQTVEKSFFIPRLNSFTTDDYVWMRDDLPLYTQTLSSNGEYDLFFNAFIHLSRLEEWISETKGYLIRSYSTRHPRKNTRIWDIPVVNRLFEELENKLRRVFPQLKFNNAKEATIELSHDVDYIQKTPQLRIKQTAFGFYQMAKSLASEKKIKQNFVKTFRFLFSNSSYWCFEYWQELEKRFHKRSIFYVYAKAAPQNLKTWLLDPSYDVSRNKKFQLKLKELLAEGFEVGLHGSFKSAFDQKLLTKEKEILELILGHAVLKTRQHWLNYGESQTPSLHNQLFKFDSTLGWNDRMGFRSGCASQYRPYNHQQQKAFDYFETPLVVMDSQIYDYGFNQTIQMQAKCESMLSEVSKIKNAHVSLSWHQRVSSDDYKWNSFYEELIA